MKFEKYTIKSGKIKWRFYHYFGIDEETGRPIDIKRQGFDSKQEAREALMKIVTQYEDEQIYEKKTGDKYKFKEVVNLWLIHYKDQVKITTYTTTKSLLKNHIMPRFKDYYIRKIDVRMCQEAVIQ